MEKSNSEEKQSIWKVCKRCNRTYNAASNTSTSCRFHPSFFVCRRHDDQKRTRSYDVSDYFGQEGTMNWGRMIRPMLPSSMTAVGLRSLTRRAALPIFMSLMMMTTELM